MTKNIDVIFEVIQKPKDKSDTDLKNSYTAPARKREIINYAIKELQGTLGLKGHISLIYHQNKRNAALKIR